MRDPHDWNSWDNYLDIHDKRIDDLPFVLENHLEWTLVEDPPRHIVLEGHLLCEKQIVIRVLKVLETRHRRGRLEVRGSLYEYNAHFAGRHNILRYDNSHMDRPDDFHKHEFEVATGEELRRAHISRAEMPTLAGFVEEVRSLVGG